MCAIIGALILSPGDSTYHNQYLNEIFDASLERGRDGQGWATNGSLPGGERYNHCINLPVRRTTWGPAIDFLPDQMLGSLIGNLRAEPTTEYVAVKSGNDQQPYSAGPWTIVHNGTIANDKELRTHELSTPIDSAAIVELLNSENTEGYSRVALAEHFSDAMLKLKGSFAILAFHENYPDLLFTYCNYRPIWYSRKRNNYFFASSREYLGPYGEAQMLPPYSMFMFDVSGKTQIGGAFRAQRKALSVCSGGLDSVVATVMAMQTYETVEIIHFGYGSRATWPEVRAINAVAKHLGIRVNHVPMRIYDEKDSPLLREDSTIAGGEAGAEFAHEWVPARNLVMLALATAYAEANGFDTIVLGNNLEEAGAYPDNEPEFIRRFNDLLPFATGDGKHVQVIMPVGNLMKHEIVATGLALKAPLHLTWSCYRAGEQHCGTCGPCFMRKTAFAINHAPEVITYACDAVTGE